MARTTRIQLAPEIQADFDRIIDHLTQHEVRDQGARIKSIIRAIDALQHNPLIGRPVSGGKNELVIGRDSAGYVALYRYEATLDVVFVLAIRSQREAGYSLNKDLS